MRDETDLDAAAARLVAARRSGVLLADLPTGERPRDLDEAYGIQRRFLGLWGDALAGWKVGATSREVQRLFGVDAPILGPVFRGDVATSPARLSAAAHPHRLLESELAFRFGRDLPPTPQARKAAVLDAVEAVIPAIEIIGPRFDRLTTDDIATLTADCGANGGAILGPACTAWRGRDLVAQRVRLSIGGALRQEGTGALVLGDPATVLVWLVEALGRLGIGIAAGQVVLTGTMTGLHAPAPGEVAVADFGDLGEVEVAFG